MDPVRRLLAAGACLAVLGGLAGCGEDPEPQFEAEPSGSPSVAETPTASESAEPAPWEEKSPDGAVAFVEHWLATFDAAKKDGEVAALRSMSSPTCKTCSNFIDLIAGVYADGGSISSKGWKVRSVSEPVRSKDETRIAVNVLQTPQKITRSAGAEVEEFEGGPLSLAMTVSWRSGAWSMRDVDAIA